MNTLDSMNRPDIAGHDRAAFSTVRWHQRAIGSLRCIAVNESFTAMSGLLLVVLLGFSPVLAQTENSDGEVPQIAIAQGQPSGPTAEETVEQSEAAESPQLSQQRRLTWRLELGRQYRLLVERVLAQKVTDREWVETIRYELIWTVTGVEDEVMQIRQTLDAVAHTIQFSDEVRHSLRFNPTR